MDGGYSCSQTFRLTDSYQSCPVKDSSLGSTSLWWLKLFLLLWVIFSLM